MPSYKKEIRAAGEQEKEAENGIWLNLNKKKSAAQYFTVNRKKSVETDRDRRIFNRFVSQQETYMI